MTVQRVCWLFPLFFTDTLNFFSISYYFTYFPLHYFNVNLLHKEIFHKYFENRGLIYLLLLTIKYTYLWKYNATLWWSCSFLPVSVAYRVGCVCVCVCVQTPPPKFRSFDKAAFDGKLSGKCLVFLFQHPNLFEISEFRTPTPHDIRKKGSKILKLPRFAIVLH